MSQTALEIRCGCPQSPAISPLRSEVAEHSGWGFNRTRILWLSQKFSAALGNNFKFWSYLKNYCGSLLCLTCPRTTHDFPLPRNSYSRVSSLSEWYQQLPSSASKAIRVIPDTSRTPQTHTYISYPVVHQVLPVLPSKYLPELAASRCVCCCPSKPGYSHLPGPQQFLNTAPYINRRVTQPLPILHVAARIFFLNCKSDDICTPLPLPQFLKHTESFPLLTREQNVWVTLRGRTPLLFSLQTHVTLLTFSLHVPTIDSIICNSSNILFLPFLRPLQAPRIHPKHFFPFPTN